MIIKDLKKRMFTSIFLLTIFLLIFKFNLILVLSLLILGVFSLIEFLNIINKIIKNKIYFLISTIFFSIYVFSFCIIFFLFANIIQLKIILFSLLLCCVASDIGGFIFGKILKGPKLTSISPNKTIAGAFGSIIFSILFFSGSLLAIIKDFNFIFIVIAITTSIACQSGDLFFSYLKRKAKMKDTGKFLPGHGGVLDRLDGIFLGMPLGFVSFILLY